MAPLGVVGAALWAYHNTFENPFVFDDIGRIAQNTFIRQLWPPWHAMAETTRPFVQLTFALNYAMSGLDVWSYHALNLAIHALAGLTLFGVIRRTLARPVVADRFRSAADSLGFAASVIWVVHPLQTQAVTYLVQRAESLASLFYLLTLYCAIRSAGSRDASRWTLAAIAACALGMASKPMVATAPLAVLAYDRVFLSGSFRQLWSERRALHVGLFATLGVLPLLLANGPLEWHTSAGLDVPGITPLAYAMTEPGVILHYLRLCLWPHPLVLDYDWPIARAASAVVGPGLALAALATLSIVSSWRGQRLGFLGIWFFLILAPTSSFIPIADPAFEHRLYLPLAAVVVLGTLAGSEAIRTLGLRFHWTADWTRTIAVALVVLVVGALATLAVRRNLDYRSSEAIWLDTVAKRPKSPKAHFNLALEYLRTGRAEEAIARMKQALSLDPRYARAHVGIGYLLSMMGRSDEALPHARAAVGLDPSDGEAQFLLGSVLLQRDSLDEAYDHLAEAVRLEPERSTAHLNLGIILERRGQWPEAIVRYAEATRLKPDDANAHCSLGLALSHGGRRDEARRELEKALALQPGFERAQRGLEELEPPSRERAP